MMIMNKLDENRAESNRKAQKKIRVKAKLFDKVLRPIFVAHQNEIAIMVSDDELNKLKYMENELDELNKL